VRLIPTCCACGEDGAKPLATISTAAVSIGIVFNVDLMVMLSISAAF
jgi:hypothetical protein